MPVDTGKVASIASDIRDDDRLVSALESAVDVHKEKEGSDKWEEYDHAGFTYDDLGCPPWTLTQLCQKGVLKKTYSSNNGTTQYRVDDVDAAEEVLKIASGDHDSEADPEASLEDVDPESLFENVVGRDEKKKWFRRTIAEDVDVHHLLCGAPGSGKSTITDELVELPGARRVVLSGNQSSAAGIVDLLLEEQPTILVVEEMEKGSKADREALMTLCGQGYVEVTKGGGHGSEQVNLDTIVFATANDVDAITPPSLVDRFLTWEFERYSFEEFKEVCVGVLPEKYPIDEDLAAHIARELYERADSSSVRSAEDVAKLARTPHEVEMLVEDFA